MAEGAMFSERGLFFLGKVALDPRGPRPETHGCEAELS